MCVRCVTDTGMLDRPDPPKPPSRRASSPAAIRARERRARQRAGIECDLRVRVPTRRLVAAMRAANPRLRDGELSPAEIEAELEAIVLAFVDRWLLKNPHT
jgi:hypothetical protein